MNRYIYVSGNMTVTDASADADARDIYYSLINEYMVQPIINRLSMDVHSNVPVVNIVITDSITVTNVPQKFSYNEECHDITIFINISNPYDSFVIHHTKHLSLIDYDYDHVCHRSSSHGCLQQSCSCHCHWSREQLDEELELIAQEIAAFHEQS